MNAGKSPGTCSAGAESLVVALWSVEIASAKTLVQKMFQEAASRSFGHGLVVAKREMIASAAPFRPIPDVSFSLAHPVFLTLCVLGGGELKNGLQFVVSCVEWPAGIGAVAVIEYDARFRAMHLKRKGRGMLNKRMLTTAVAMLFVVAMATTAGAAAKSVRFTVSGCGP